MVGRRPPSSPVAAGTNRIEWKRKTLAPVARYRQHFFIFFFLLLTKQLALTVLTHHGSAVGAGNIGVSFRFSNLFFNNGFYRKFSRAYFTAGGRRRNVTLPVVWLFLILRSLLAPLARAVCRHFFRSIHTHSHTCLLTRGGCW